MLLQTNSYIVPKERRNEHARLMRRFRQALINLGCESFEVYEMAGPNWTGTDSNGRYVQIMRFRDRRQQKAIQDAEKNDPEAQKLIAEFCRLVNFEYQQQQGYFGVGFYNSVLANATTALPDAGASDFSTPEAVAQGVAATAFNYEAGHAAAEEQLADDEEYQDGEDQFGHEAVAGDAQVVEQNHEQLPFASIPQGIADGNVHAHRDHSSTEFISAEVTSISDAPLEEDEEQDLSHDLRPVDYAQPDENQFEELAEPGLEPPTIHEHTEVAAAVAEPGADPGAETGTDDTLEGDFEFEGFDEEAPPAHGQYQPQAWSTQPTLPNKSMSTAIPQVMAKFDTQSTGEPSPEPQFSEITSENATEFSEFENADDENSPVAEFTDSEISEPSVGELIEEPTTDLAEFEEFSDSMTEPLATETANEFESSPATDQPDHNESVHEQPHHSLTGLPDNAASASDAFETLEFGDGSAELPHPGNAQSSPVQTNWHPPAAPESVEVFEELENFEQASDTNESTEGFAPLTEEELLGEMTGPDEAGLHGQPEDDSALLESISPDGYFMTGDAGFFDENWK